MTGKLGKIVGCFKLVRDTDLDKLIEDQKNGINHTFWEINW